MAERPTGRKKNVTGSAGPIHKRGSGLGTGPVGNQEGYAGRPGTSADVQQQTAAPSGTGGTRVTRSKGSLIGIIIAVVVALAGGGTGLSSLLGNLGGGGTANVLNMFTGSGAESSGWTQKPETGVLNTAVASSARSKRTTIRGNKKDVVTIMVYMCGTDLESKYGMGTSDLSEMAAATIGSNVNLIVYTGGCAKWQNSVVSTKYNQIYKVANGKLTCLVSNDGTASMTNPNTLTKFIKFCTDGYPANRYDLILWDHGGGSVTGYGYDEKNASSGSMTLKGIQQALKNAGTTFDFIGFDACLMATLENSLMLDDFADYLIASEEVEPGIGWYYTDWLTELSNNTSMPTTEIGKNIIDGFVSACDKKGCGTNITLSLVDLAELSATVPSKLSAFANATSALLQNGNYEKVSAARSGSKEFATSNKIDQVDLAHLAYNLGTKEGTALAEALRSAVKYNRTAASVTNAYGLSIYFPYSKTSTVNSAVATYDAIGMDDDYAACIRQFASMESAGQASSTGTASPLSSLLGGGSGSSPLDLGTITSLLGSLTGGSSSFFGKNLSTDSVARYILNNQFDASALVWKGSGGQRYMKLGEEQWSLVNELLLNVFVDDGEGYLDLGMDNTYEFDSEGNLLGSFDGTWLAIDGKPVAYYFVSSVTEGKTYTINGRVPVLLNGERAELLLVFDNAHPYGVIAGVRPVYAAGETETVAKSADTLNVGDRIEFICDYYAYSGAYLDTYSIGEMTYSGSHTISNVSLDGNKISAVYRFTDIYGNVFWTPEMN